MFFGKIFQKAFFFWQIFQKTLNPENPMSDIVKIDMEEEILERRTIDGMKCTVEPQLSNFCNLHL